MRTRDWAASLVLVLGVGAVVALGQAQSQPQQMPMGQMGGTQKDKCGCPCMDMGQGKSMGMGMNMGQGKTMDMGQAKPMDMDRAKSKPSVPAGALKVAFGDKSAEWTPATLVAMPHKTLTVCNEHVKAYETYAGVPLIDLLARLGVPENPHGKDLRLYLVAEGSDGYKAVYAVAEVNPDVHDATVIVADAINGKPLAEDGPLKLVATGEKRPARWVRNLVSIRVMTAE